MPPPVSFIDIPSFPFNRIVTPAEFNIANEIWFRRISPTEECFGSFATRNLGLFLSTTQVYAADGTTLLHTITPAGGEQFSWYFIFSAGTYYIKIINSLGGGTINDFTCSFDKTPILTTIPIGSLLINDDTNGFPATVINNNLFSGVYKSIPAGECVAVLPTGESLWHDRFGMYGINHLAIFDASVNYVTSVDTPFRIGGAFPLISHDNTKFYVYDPNDKNVYSVTIGGIVSFVCGPLDISNKFALGVKRDGTILYYSKGKFDGIIYKFDIIGNILLPNLYAIPGWTTPNDLLAMTPNFNPGEILVLSDNTIVTYWYDASATTTHILHLTEAGVIINDYSFNLGVEGFIDHISYGLVDPLGTIVVWFQNAALTQGHFQTLNLSTGALTSILPTDMFSTGINLHGNSPIIFAPSESCGMISYLLSVIPPPVTPTNTGSGIYKLVPGKYNDTLWNEDLVNTTTIKIPNPTGRTGYVG